MAAAVRASCVFPKLVHVWKASGNTKTQYAAIKVLTSVSLYTKLSIPNSMLIYSSSVYQCDPHQSNHGGMVQHKVFVNKFLWCPFE